jgi:mannose-6-phosphate isomerase-like protein (cupin superfamily)
VTTDDVRARYRDHAVIRASGAVSGLADGAQSTINGLTTRLVAWPGTGFQTEAVHVITVEAGQESERYRYDLAEEALLCHSGGGEVWLRDAWVPLEPGDMAYVPEGIERAVRVPATADQPLVLVAQITPPQIDHYAAHGFYNVELGVMNYDSIRKACTDARAGPKPGRG